MGWWGIWALVSCVRARSLACVVCRLRTSIVAFPWSIFGNLGILTLTGQQVGELRARLVGRLSTQAEGFVLTRNDLESTLDFTVPFGEDDTATVAEVLGDEAVASVGLLRMSPITLSYAATCVRGLAVLASPLSLPVSPPSPFPLSLPTAFAFVAAPNNVKGLRRRWR